MVIEFPLRHALQKVALASLLLTAIAIAAGPCLAQTTPKFPNRPVRIIVPFTPGSASDIIARRLGLKMSENWGEQVVVDNRGGAGGMIGTELAARAAPDGYTLLMCSQGPIIILPHLQKSVPYDTLRDFAAVSLISASTYVLVTHPATPYKTIKDLIAAAKADPGKINYASAGNGAPNHLASESFKHMAGINLRHVPYKGAPQSIVDVLGGHVPVIFGSIPQLSPHVKAARLRALGVSHTKRIAQLPDVPTISEAGVPGYEFYAWFGLLAPAKTPKPIVQRLNEVLRKALRAPETASQFEAQGSDPVGNSPEQFAIYLRREYDKTASVVKAAGLKVD